jgi:peptide methionine sulfoxide reductase msrA/msrB
MWKSASLPASVLAVVRDKGTERAFTGEYDEFGESGTYLCRQCGLALFRSETKFHSGCGWPSFDADIEGAVLRERDADGRRTEILCSRCRAHLGHVFVGEYLTANNLRHCVNSLSLDFVADKRVTETEEVIVAGGCFWGVEALFRQLPGVLKAESGYTGGKRDNPTYEQICSGATGHYEAVRVVYDPAVISAKAVFKYFFEIHDPRQPNGQGPDRGQQYLSVAFYYDEMQRKIIQDLIRQLESKGYQIATSVLPVAPFWRAESYHQNYYGKNGKQPYCHRYEKRF